MIVIIVEGDRVLISWKGAEPITIYSGRVKIAELYTYHIQNSKGHPIPGFLHSLKTSHMSSKVWQPKTMQMRSL